ncbi:MAG: toll/interleukin-1 receptor domain-containing protein [Ktedonobacteraceae bacterium]
MGENTLLGGRGVPIECALEVFPCLKTGQEQLPAQHGQWVSSLTPQQRETSELGKLVVQNKVVTLFFSYQNNPKDLKWVEKLQKQLIVWQRQGVIHAWHMGALEVGEAWEELSTQRLNSSQVILLLVSPDYTNDDHLYNLHVQRAMERRATGDATVIPILVRPTAGLHMTPFASLKSTPSNGKPMSQWADDDLASMTVAQEIARVVEKIRDKKY